MVCGNCGYVRAGTNLHQLGMCSSNHQQQDEDHLELAFQAVLGAGSLTPEPLLDNSEEGFLAVPRRGEDDGREDDVQKDLKHVRLLEVRV